ncbi:FAD-binding protein, partial [Frankia canadensis]|uniref:FAD-binding protein n=1 Tax=Frankia canadensis TaxID=1836972 RepID=UPI001A9C3A2D
MRVAVLVKQVPVGESLVLGPDGRLRRDGVAQEMNPYCRRAVTQGVRIAAATGGHCTVLTLGPPSAEDALREAVACGADAGVLVSDPAFAGSDTLATARALVAALRLLGPVDLVLCGRNSVDGDTGQLGPQVAALLGWPFVGGMRELALRGATLDARCEGDDGWLRVRADAPLVASCAERLCEPAKAPLPARAAVPADRLRHLVAADLGPGPWGAAASRTVVGPTRTLARPRLRTRLSGPLEHQVAEAVRLLAARGALDAPETGAETGAETGVGSGAGTGVGVRSGGVPSRAVEAVDPAVPSTGALALGDPGIGERLLGASHVAPPPPVAGQVSATVTEDGNGDGAWPVVGVLLEPDREREGRELLGAASWIARALRGRVVALAPAGADRGEPSDLAMLGAHGADDLVVLAGVALAHDVATALAGWCGGRRVAAVLCPSTMWGREVAGRVAATLDAGLTGDAIDVGVEDDRLVCLKPAFGGRQVATITAVGEPHLATVRPGALPLREPRQASPPSRTMVEATATSTVRVLEAHRDDDVEILARASAVVGVGQGIDPTDYPLLTPLLAALGAQLAATRKVTDNGWLPRARQVGITGRSIAPRLYVALGLSGKFNHMSGVAAAGTVLAVNPDPAAPVFDEADIGIVGTWREVTDALTAALAERALTAGVRPGGAGSGGAG